MRIFSLLLAIFFYVIPLFFYIILITSQTLKKHKLAIVTMIGYFISIFVSVAIMSWALVMMNGGFRVNIHISIDYSWLIILLCVLIGVNLIWYYLFMRKNIYFIDKKDSPLITTVGFFFPIILSITLTLMTGLVYFVCNYYLYLCEMKL